MYKLISKKGFPHFVMLNKVKHLLKGGGLSDGWQRNLLFCSVGTIPPYQRQLAALKINHHPHPLPVKGNRVFK